MTLWWYVSCCALAYAMAMTWHFQTSQSWDAEAVASSRFGRRAGSLSLHYLQIRDPFLHFRSAAFGGRRADDHDLADGKVVWEIEET